MSLNINNVDKIVGSPPVHIIKNITLKINDGEFVSLTGKSGSGKSTLLYIMSSLDNPSSGFVELDGKNINTISKKQLYSFRNMHIGFIFQFHYLIAELSAIENVLLPTRKCNLQKEKYEYAVHLLERFGLQDKINRLPRQLSGGEQQRVAVARAFVMNPKYLFADEPTGALDSKNSRIVMETIIELNEKNKTTIILVTHDQEFAALSKRRIYLVDGKVSD